MKHPTQSSSEPMQVDDGLLFDVDVANHFAADFQRTTGIQHGTHYPKAGSGVRVWATSLRKMRTATRGWVQTLELVRQMQSPMSLSHSSTTKLGVLHCTREGHKSSALSSFGSEMVQDR